MSEQNEQLSNDLNIAGMQLNNAMDYLDAWHDETLDGTLSSEQSDLEFKRQLIAQLIKMNYTFDTIRAALYATFGITVEAEPPA